jgi:hypothetical protein
MKKQLALLVAAATLLFSAGIALGARKPIPRFGIAKTQGFEPATSIQSSIGDFGRIWFSIVSPEGSKVLWGWEAVCWNAQEAWSIGDIDIVRDHEEGGKIEVSVDVEHTKDADSCQVSVDAASEGVGVVKISLLGAGDVPTEIPPTPEPSPSTEPSPAS